MQQMQVARMDINYPIALTIYTPILIKQEVSSVLCLAELNKAAHL